MCILRDLPLNRRTPGSYAEGAPPISYVPTFPRKHFFLTKQERSEEIKGELFA